MCYLCIVQRLKCLKIFPFVNSQLAPQISDDEIPADVDLNGPFFAEELKAVGNDISRKTNDGKNKRKRKGEREESEEDKRRKVNIEWNFDEGKSLRIH